MSVFAGVVAIGQVQPRPGATVSMLENMHAPGHNKLKRYHDIEIDVSLRHRAGESGFYSNERVTIVSDSRLDATEHLCALLRLPILEADQGSLLAAAYAKWGEAMVDHIDGEFAFAIWDKQQRSLLCARDRCGRIPFAYLVRPSGVIFATDFLPIAVCQSNALALNEPWIIDYITGATSDQESTPFKDVKRLPPGCLLHWRKDEHKVRKYWSISEIGPTFDYVDVSDISTALEQSIAKRTRDENVFAMLSGGLDSSSIAVLTRDICRKRNDKMLPTVSLVFDDPSNETERPYIESVLQQGGFDPYFVNVKVFDPIAEIQHLTRVQGAPTSGFGAPIFDQAIAKAEELGFSSALDGHGGDEIASSFGEMRFFELAQDGKWGALARELVLASRHSQLNVISNFSGLLGSRGTGFAAKLARRLHSRVGGTTRTLSEQKLLNSDWERHAAIEHGRASTGGSGASRHRTERSFQESVLADPLQSQALEFVWRQFRCRGMRLELPFWDLRVIEYCLRAPSQQKLKNGVPRSLIREMMKGRLPSMVANRTSKFDFSDWFVRSVQLSADSIQQYASLQNHPVFDYVDHVAFETATNDLRHQDGVISAQSSRKIWTVLNLLLWMDMVEALQAKQKEPLEIPC